MNIEIERVSKYARFTKLSSSQNVEGYGDLIISNITYPITPELKRRDVKGDIAKTIRCKRQKMIRVGMKKGGKTSVCHPNIIIQILKILK